MKCVILQPSYIPWRGTFDLIHQADLFIFYDDVQYEHRSWRNRNRIKTPGGSLWLTIPVHVRGHQSDHTPINEVPIAWERPWNELHRTSLQHSYGKAPFFKKYVPLLDEFYSRRDERLADFTIDFTLALSRELGIEKTRFRRSSEFKIEGRKTDRLLALLKAAGATHYLTGPAAKDYLNEAAFEKEGITLEYMHYDYPEYPQLHPPFDPQVSVLDLLFMTGPAAAGHIWRRNGR